MARCPKKAKPASVKLGYLAIDQYGTMLRLTDTHRSPRQQLLSIMGVKSCSKMYVDLKDGGARHAGYIVAGYWYTIHEVHAWHGSGR